MIAVNFRVFQETFDGRGVDLHMGNKALQERITQAVDRALNWMIDNMLVAPDGSKGVYERVRIDLNEITTWVRPDCNAEISRVLAVYNGTVEPKYLQLYKNILNWVLQTQNSDSNSELYGSFPFYVTAPRDGSEPFIEEFRWANDNGKILSVFIDLYNLTGDKTLLDAALKGTVYWKKSQVDDGTFKPETLKGVCFTSWMTNAFLQCYEATGDESLVPVIEKGMGWILSKQLDSGRFLTSFETANNENWRPVSSEQAIAVYLLSRANAVFDNRYGKEFDKALEYLLSLQHDSGAILNCKEDSLSASEQNNQNLADLVYTQGYALMALYNSWKVTGYSDIFNAFNSLAGFLLEIQCANESPLWDGAWRGSFDVNAWEWAGRADQRNELDEGGMYSVYTGWCVAPICYGLLLLRNELGTMG